MPLALLFFIFLGSSVVVSGNDTSTFSFGASPGVFYRKGTDLIIGFNLRKEGDRVGISFFAFPERSRWRPNFEKLISAGDFQRTYYSIETSSEPPKVRIFTMPVIDPKSQQALWDSIQVTPDSLILSIKSISQNEFLNVNPRIVPDPTKKLCDTSSP